jgi:hypothetical protein
MQLLFWIIKGYKISKNENWKSSNGNKKNHICEIVRYIKILLQNHMIA